ncbi:TetR/AcrR family transcriptional regulator [Streptomyces sp. 150FB]|uniref:TetR/AcrR family transcriptional regulator n=1 Tax=Streptomyces sp. 150FB TaxID=1576605 RepID=UPI000AEE98DE|nr:TetR/AcrR family transcriptional regulator [Streptomyces sp. 150FB]
MTDETPARKPEPEPRTQPERLTLRERKKRETRQRISDVATTLFAARGFDQVTVAEVADVANVSAMTVFNHFARKEDLFLDRIPEAIEMFSTAVRDRQHDESPLAALRRMLLALLDERHPLSGVADRFTGFWQIVIDSPALRARAREGVDEVERAVETALAETGLPPADAHLVAALAIASYRSVYLTTARRLLAGEHADDLADDHRARLNDALDILERALAPERLSPGPS